VVVELAAVDPIQADAFTVLIFFKVEFEAQRFQNVGHVLLFVPLFVFADFVVFDVDFVAALHFKHLHGHELLDLVEVAVEDVFDLQVFNVCVAAVVEFVHLETDDHRPDLHVEVLDFVATGEAA